MTNVTEAILSLVGELRLMLEQEREKSAQLLDEVKRLQLQLGKAENQLEGLRG